MCKIHKLCTKNVFYLDCPDELLFESSCSILFLFRDGGLKRDKVKDSFKEEQQKNYSKIIAGPNNVSQKDNGLVA